MNKNFDLVSNIGKSMYHILDAFFRQIKSFIRFRLALVSEGQAIGNNTQNYCNNNNNNGQKTY